MKIKFVLLILVLILFAIIYFALINLSNVANNEGVKTSQVIINNQVINVELAQTVRQQAKGLSDRDSLVADRGMLFVFPNLTVRNFWMKDMRIPLDIIWIKDNTITSIEANAPIPSENEKVLPVYSSPTVVNYVLEVNAGFCEKNMIKIGDKVTFNNMNLK